MSLVYQQLQEVKCPVRFAAGEMIQRVAHGIAVFFRWSRPGPSDPRLASCLRFVEAGRRGDPCWRHATSRAHGNAPQTRAPARLARAPRSVQGARTWQGKSGASSISVVDDLRGLRVPARGCERRREADAKDHVEWVLLDCTVMFRDRLLGASRQTKVEVGVHVPDSRRDGLSRHRGY